jgi:cytochrome P450
VVTVADASGSDDPELFLRLSGPTPQPVYCQMAEESGGVVELGNGAVRLLNMADILAVNRHRDVLGTGAHGPSNGAERPLIPLDLDGPIHTKYRKLLDPLFAPQKVAALEPEIRRLTDRLIDGFADRGEIDAYEAFCTPLPSIMFLSIMGIPQTEREYFLSFKNDLLHFDPFEDQAERARLRQAAAQRCYAWFEAEIDRHERTRGGSDMAEAGILGSLLRAEMDGRRLDRQTILDVTYLLMFAGLDTVSASLSCILSWLARHPDERRRIVAEPQLWPNAIEELMRFESPVPGGGRYATADVEINGRTFPAGTVFMVSWAAANLDPAFFPDPLTVDIERHPNPHIAFASGWHRCLGSHLARMELRVGLEQFHRRLPEYEIADPDGLHYWPLGVRMADQLPLRLGPRAESGS